MKIYRNNWYAIVSGIVAGLLLDYLGLGIMLAALVSGLLVGLFTTRLRLAIALSILSGIVWPTILLGTKLMSSMSMEMLSLVAEVAGFPTEAMLALTYIIIIVVSILAGVIMNILADLTLNK